MSEVPDQRTNAARNAEVRPVKGLVLLVSKGPMGPVEIIGGSPEALLGFGAEAWLREGFLLDHVDPADREQALEVLAGDTWHSADGTPGPCVAEVRLRRADGGTVWVQVMVVRQPGAEHEASDDADEPLLHISLLDIDSQVQLETAWAETVDTMRDALVTTSNEIAHPVNEISDFGGMLERHLSAQDDDIGSEYALGIRSAVERMRGFAEGLAKLGRGGSASGTSSRNS